MHGNIWVTHVVFARPVIRRDVEAAAAAQGAPAVQGGLAVQGPPPVQGAPASPGAAGEQPTATQLAPSTQASDQPFQALTSQELGEGQEKSFAAKGVDDEDPE